MRRLLIFLTLISSFSFGQNKPEGKFINDAINENNYIIFFSDMTFKYRYSYSVMHDVACGKYEIINDTIYFTYLTDMRDTICNNEIDAKFHYDSTLKYLRPLKLFYENDRLLGIKEGKAIRTAKTNRKPPESRNCHRKYILFGPYVIKDAYYMIAESKMKWRTTKKIKASS